MNLTDYCIISHVQSSKTQLLLNVMFGDRRGYSQAGTDVSTDLNWMQQLQRLHCHHLQVWHGHSCKDELEHLCCVRRTGCTCT